MGVLREESLYRCKVRFYRGGPRVLVEYFPAETGAKIFEKQHSFFPMGFFFRQKNKTGIGELTDSSRSYFYGPWNNKPPGITYVGTDSDFAGTTPYPGSPLPSELPVCPDDPGGYFPPWDCCPAGYAGPFENTCSEGYPRAVLLQLQGFALEGGYWDVSEFNGQWVKCCEINYGTFRGQLLDEDENVRVQVDVITWVGYGPDEHFYDIWVRFFNPPGTPFQQVYFFFRGIVGENCLDDTQVDYVFAFPEGSHTMPESIMLYPKPTCAGSGGGGPTPPVPSMTPLTFFSNYWNNRPWFTPRWF